MQLYLGNISGSAIVLEMTLLDLWTAVLYFAARVVLSRGIRIYSGEGI